MYNITNLTVTCACIHLISFSVSKDDFMPQATTLAELNWQQLTIKNLLNYPIVWLTCLIIFVVFIILYLINPRSSKIESKSILAYYDIIYKSVKEEKLWSDISGKEIKKITDYMPNQDEIGMLFYINICNLCI